MNALLAVAVLVASVAAIPEWLKPTLGLCQARRRRRTAPLTYAQTFAGLHIAAMNVTVEPVPLEDVCRVFDLAHTHGCRSSTAT